MAVCDVSVYFVIVRRKATNMRWFLILLVWRRLYPCRPYLAFVSVCLSCADCTHVVRAFSVYRATYEDSSKKTACLCSVHASHFSDVGQNVRRRSVCLLPSAAVTAFQQIDAAAYA